MSRSGLRYCRGPVKRTFDVVASLAGLVLLAPLFLALAILVRITSGRVVLFVQERVGQDGRPFRLIKFRSMRPDATGGLPITGSGDIRVTPFGRWLRAFKLDELPQLLNVLQGDMSIVGPRPEVPRYVAHYSEAQRRVLAARPGLTDPATLLFRNEEEFLGAIPPDERERQYLAAVMPRKLALNMVYLERAGFWYDVGLIVRTMGAIIGRRRKDFPAGPGVPAARSAPVGGRPDSVSKSSSNPLQ